MAKPVSILTGFLGSGKTTLLNAWIDAFPERRLAIIENEIGEEGIDGELVNKVESTVFEMNNGCLCCTLNDNLIELLQDLYKQKDRFDELIIETTGIADPAGVAIPFISQEAIEKAFPLKRVICLVDPTLIEDQLKETKEAIEQIAFSDILLVNKTDLVSPAYLEELFRKLQQINPASRIFTGRQGDYPLKEMWEMDQRDDFLRHSGLEHLDQKDHHHHHHHSSIETCTLHFEGAFDIEALHHRLYVFLTFQGKDIFRLKGLVWAKNEDHRVVLQSVKNNLALAPGRKWESSEKRASKFVFIGKSVNPVAIRKMLKQALAKTDGPYA